MTATGRGASAASCPATQQPGAQPEQQHKRAQGRCRELPEAEWIELHQVLRGWIEGPIARGEEELMEEREERIEGHR